MGKGGKTVRVYNQQGIMRQTDNVERKRGEDTAVHSSRGWGGAMYDSLVLMREDRRFPEASIDDGSTAELSGLESTQERRLVISRSTDYGVSLTSFNLSNIWTVVSQSTQASVILTPYLSPEGPDAEKRISVKQKTEL